MAHCECGGFGGVAIRRYLTWRSLRFDWRFREVRMRSLQRLGVSRVMHLRLVLLTQFLKRQQVIGDLKSAAVSADVKGRRDSGEQSLLQGW